MKRTVLFFTVFAGVAYTPVVLFLRCIARGTPALAPFQFFASDAFYYLSIARHSIGKTFYTSDGLFPTNGFHPLWEWLLKGLFSVPQIATDQALQLQLVFWIATVLVAVGSSLFALVLYDFTDNFALSLLAAVPGLYYMLFAVVAPDYNSSWSFINGMETPLTILGFGLLSYLTFNKRILLRPGYTATVVAGCLLTLLVLSRLDNVFLIIPYVLLALHFSPSKQTALGRALVLVAIPGFTLLVYVLHNYSYAGSLLPVSGNLKHGVSLPLNFYYSLLSFIPIAVINSDSYWSEGTMRILQLTVPAILAAVTLAGWARWFRDAPATERRDRYQPTVIAGLCLYVILKSAFNFAFVPLWGQGHWYFVASIMIFSLILCSVIGWWLEPASPRIHGPGLAMASFAFIILVGNAFITHKTLSEYNTLYYDFWIRRASIESDLRALDPNVRIVEYDDGPIAYALDIPTMNGFGYTLDQAAIDAKSRGQLLQLAYERGFHVIGLLYYYPTLPIEQRGDPSTLRAIVRGLPNLGAEDLTKWKFSLFYGDPDSRALFIKFEPAGGIPSS